jgi:hypothetical protein
MLLWVCHTCDFSSSNVRDARMHENATSHIVTGMVIEVRK